MGSSAAAVCEQAAVEDTRAACRAQEGIRELVRLDRSWQGTDCKRYRLWSNHCWQVELGPTQKARYVNEQTLNHYESSVIFKRLWLASVVSYSFKQMNVCVILPVCKSASSVGASSADVSRRFRPASESFISSTFLAVGMFRLSYFGVKWHVGVQDNDDPNVWIIGLNTELA